MPSALVHSSANDSNPLVDANDSNPLVDEDHDLRLEYGIVPRRSGLRGPSTRGGLSERINKRTVLKTVAA
ncbi:hypothetical protein [Streptomyces sp. NPDC001743]|uniref:hypothetical protein n=1 Tax=Streptomyces sp. NPDC001743 TaxID=3154397 RepID=UPI00331F8B17